MSTAPAAVRLLRPTTPLDLELTLAPLARGPRDPTLRVEPDGRGGTRIRLALRWPEDAARGLLVVLDRTAAGPLSPVRVRAWGDPDAARAFLGRAEDHLGLHDGTEAFQASDAYALLPARLRGAARERPGLRLARTGLLVHQLVRAVLEQRVTGAEAISAWQQLVRRYGEPAPPSPFSGDLVVPPRPAQWLDVPSWTWREQGVDQARVRAVRGGVEQALVLAQRGAAQDVAGLARSLAGVPGIGPWTLAETLAPSHGLPDAVSVGDYHLAHHVTWALTGRRGDDEAMLEVLRPWAGNRQRVVRMLQAYGPREPRRGPRTAPAPHRFG